MRQRKAKDLEKRLERCGGYIVRTDDGSLQEYCDAQAPLYVEIGCGKGQFIIKKAASDPDGRFLAIEGQETVILRAAEKAMCISGETEWPENVPGEERMEGVSAKLDNLKFVNFFVEHMADFFEEGQLSGVYLNFSDPWPKARNAKRRLTHRSKLAAYEACAAPGALLQFKTDNDGLFAFSLDEIRSRGLLIRWGTKDLHHSPYAARNVETEYEQKFSAKGKSINCLQAVLSRKGGKNGC